MAILSSKQQPLEFVKPAAIPVPANWSPPNIDDYVASSDTDTPKKRKHVQIGPSVQVVSYDGAVPISDLESPIKIQNKATNLEALGQPKRTSRSAQTTKSVSIGETVRELTFDIARPPTNIRQCHETTTKAKEAARTSPLKRRVECLDEAGTAEFAKYFNKYYVRRCCRDEKKEIARYESAWRDFLLEQEEEILWVVWSADVESDSNWEDE